jgi:hypothetical protein
LSGWEFTVDEDLVRAAGWSSLPASELFPLELLCLVLMEALLFRRKLRCMWSLRNDGIATKPPVSQREVEDVRSRKKMRWAAGQLPVLLLLLLLSTPSTQRLQVLVVALGG